MKAAILILLALCACNPRPLEPAGIRTVVGQTYDHNAIWTSILVRLVREPETGLCFAVTLTYTGSNVAMSGPVPCPAETFEGAR